jgi:hypothetical protein
MNLKLSSAIRDGNLAVKKEVIAYGIHQKVKLYRFNPAKMEKQKYIKFSNFLNIKAIAILPTKCAICLQQRFAIAL